jgi:hypothetical protein
MCGEDITIAAIRPCYAEKIRLAMRVNEALQLWKPALALTALAPGQLFF